MIRKIFVLLLSVSWQVFSYEIVDPLKAVATENEAISILLDLDRDERKPPSDTQHTARSELDPDCWKDVSEIVQTRGYDVEKHYVTTKDGYILTLFRIPQGKTTASVNSPGSEIKAPVILQHGLLDSAYTWVNNFETQSLAYILADAGFDVWLGNNRGNFYGRNHTTLNPDDGTEAFWSFTWDEMALYDAPAMIDYATSLTGSSSIGWVGHSEGTIQLFAAGSSFEENADDQYFMDNMKKINLFVALAPVAYVSNMDSKVLKAVANSDIVERLQKRGRYEFLSEESLKVAPQLCAADPHGCNQFIALLCGPTKNINETRYQVYVSQTPAGTSIRNMDHWLQSVVVQDSFMRYDFGSEEANMVAYGYTTPPVYDLTKYSLYRTAIFSGGNDYLADPADVQKLLSLIPAERIVYSEIIDDYGHMDFTWAYNAGERIYPKVSELLRTYASV